MIIHNLIATDVASDALEEGTCVIKFVIAAEGGDLRVQIDGDASADPASGELVPQSGSATFHNLLGRRVSVIALTGSDIESEGESESESELEGTIYAAFTLREEL